jgi:hypothetical protein
MHGAAEADAPEDDTMTDFTQPLSVSPASLAKMTAAMFTPTQIEIGLHLGNLGKKKFAALRGEYMASAAAYLTEAERADLMARVYARHEAEMSA